MQNLSKIGQETKKLQKMGNDVIVTSFLKIAQQFFVCIFYSCLLMYHVSKKGITGGWYQTPPGAENDQKSPGRIGLIKVTD